MNPETQSAATENTPAGATVGASLAPEQQQGQNDAARGNTPKATAPGAMPLSELLKPAAQDTPGQPAVPDGGTAEDPVSRDMRAVEGRNKEKVRRAERDAFTLALEKAEQRFAAMLDDRLAPIRTMYEQQAASAIAREFPNLPPEVAQELAQARAAKALGTQPAQAGLTDTAQERPRDAQGRFTAQAGTAQATTTDDTAPEADTQQENQRRVDAKVQQLRGQAAEIRQLYGLDMLGLVNEDEEIRRGIIEQDRDFYWALAVLDKRPGGNQAQPPVVRQANYTGRAGTAFDNMSSEQLNALNEQLRKGATIDPRR